MRKQPSDFADGDQYCIYMVKEAGLIPTALVVMHNIGRDDDGTMYDIVEGLYKKYSANVTWN